MKSKSIRPTFLGIGGQKCASTWVSECLRYHPEVFMASPKELRYFDEQMAEGKDINWYLDFYSAAVGFKAVGEFTSTYLTGVKRIPVIRELIGPVQIVVILRNPAERFVSHFMQCVRSCYLPDVEFNELTVQNLDRALAKQPDMFVNGLYTAPLQQYMNVFGQDRVLVLLKDDIDHDPSHSLVRLFEFLGVDSSFTPPMRNTQVGEAFLPKFPVLDRMRRFLYWRVYFRAPSIINAIKRSGASELYRKLNARPSRVVVRDGVVEELRSRYAEDVAQLAKLLGRDLSHWQQNQRNAAAVSR